MPYLIGLLFFLLPFLSLPIHSEEAEVFVKGRILVKMAPRHMAKAQEHISKILKAKKVKNFSLIDGLHLYEFDPEIDVMEAIKLVSADESVLYAEPDYIYQTALAPQFNDPEYKKLWGLENNGQTNGKVDADINAESMWEIETGSKDVVIGIIDTGVDYSHKDLSENMWKNPNEIAGNSKDDDNNGFVDDIYGINAIKNNGDPMDDNRHGTHVAGTIGAISNNELGVLGVAHHVQIAACKFLSKSGTGSISDAIECMQYFAELKSRKENPVNLVAVNNSWGGGSFSQAMLDAIKTHEKLGILFIAAAGNASNNNDSYSFYPATYNVKNIISVAATDHNDELAYFSNYGKKTVHIAAPGAGILSTLPNNEYGSLSGTSMAAPHVAGLTAIIASHFPDLKYAGIKNLVLAGGQKVSSLSEKVLSGRRIRGADKDGVGSLTCKDQTLVVKDYSLATKHNMKVGETLSLSASFINCQANGGELVIYSSDDEAITLKDDGLLGDEKADDGISSLDWQPTKAGTYELRFSDREVISVVVEDK